jgi:type IV pilus assembly protein PilC
MRPWVAASVLVAVGVGVVLATAWAVTLLALAEAPFAIPLVLLGVLFAGWGAYAYLRTRQGRRDELLQLLSAAVGSGVPLAPAVRAYVAERPNHRWAWGVAFIGTLGLFPLAPWGPVLWLWLWWTRFDRRARQFARRLDGGASLTEAFREVPAVAAAEARLAAAVGEDTGRLADALRRADRESLAAAWVELLPRLLYPFVVLLVVANVATFLMTVILPKYLRIFAEFGEKLPAATQWLRDLWGGAVEPFLALIPVGLVASIGLVVLLVGSPSARWRLPVFGRLYRWEVQGQVLRLLGSLVGAGRPAPTALRTLAGFDDFPPPARRRLLAAAGAADRGDPLADALRGAGLLPKGMAPLVRAAEPAGTLPWVLAELGEAQGGRALRLVRRTSLVVSPLLVVAVGGVVGFVVVAMFVPLIALLTRLSE